MTKEPEVIELCYEAIKRETERAYLIEFVVYIDGEPIKETIWLPKSQVDFRSDNMNVIIMPVWLYDEKIREIREKVNSDEVEWLEYTENKGGGYGTKTGSYIDDGNSESISR